MSVQKRFLIAPTDGGLQTNVKPWLIPDKSFAQLNNAYCFRGRIIKRFGSRFMNKRVPAVEQQLYSRLRVKIGTTNGAGNFTTGVPGTVFAQGQMFSVGSNIFTVNVTGTPATMLIYGTASLATYNTTTGAVVINGTATSTDVYFYPATPVMGLIVYEKGDINDYPTLAFDTQFAYQREGAAGLEGWNRLSAETTPGAAIWTGSNSQFFWGATYQATAASNPCLFVSNFNLADGMRTFDVAADEWNFFRPAYNDAGKRILSARIIIPFKNRLVLLNTYEEVGVLTPNFANRCRFSQNGSALESDAWNENTPGKGGYIDAPTQDPIITAQLLRDRLIVFCLNSTWELVYTQNPVLPFVWQQINTELGAQSTFSEVPFDKFVFGIGQVGVHECNGVNVSRIDMAIPDQIFGISQANNGPDRVMGIRDYFKEVIYWAYPVSSLQTETINDVFPNQVLVYNYVNQTWALNDDCFTVFGYFNQQDATTWADVSQEWQTMSAPWNSPTLQSRFRQILAGNQQGYTFILDTLEDRNEESLSLLDISSTTVTAINHNLKIDDYVAIEHPQGYTLGSSYKGVYRVLDTPTQNTFTINPGTDFDTGTYTGAGMISRVSQISILTKQYNFFNQDAPGRNIYVPQVDFLVDRTTNGQLAIDFLLSSSPSGIIGQGTVDGVTLGSSILETFPYTSIPFEANKDRLWHPVYLQAEGETIQLRIYLNDTQMTTTTYDTVTETLSTIAWAPFELHAMLFYAMQTSYRYQ
jgi:hypothetical protein